MFKNLLFRALEISLGWLLGQLEKKCNNPKRYTEEQAAHLATQNEEADTTETENSERSADAAQTQEEEETGDDEEGEAECPTPPLPQEQQERKPNSHLIGLHQRLLAHLQQHYRAQYGAILSIGMGDSTSDLPFMRHCDYLLTPAESQIAQRWDDATAP